MATFVTNPVPVQGQLITHIPVVQVPVSPHPALRFKNVFLSIGIAHMLVGIICFLIGCGAFSSSSLTSYSYVGTGIWSGLWFMICGGLAGLSGIKPSQCSIIAGMVLSIIGAALAFSALVVEAFFAAIPPPCAYTYGHYFYTCPCDWSSIVGIHRALAFFCFVEMVIAIVHSSFCCKSQCRNCCGTPSTIPVHVSHPHYIPNPAYFSYGNPGGMQATSNNMGAPPPYQEQKIPQV